MKIKRNYSFDEICAFECPTCRKGHLTAAEKNPDGLKTDECARAFKIHGANAEEYHGRLATVFRCSNQHCFEHITMIARVIVDEQYDAMVTGRDPYLEPNYENRYYPLYFDPSIHIIPLHDYYPEFLKNSLFESFQVFWADPNSCGNRIRVCIERLLTHFRVPKTDSKKKPKTLHKRIEEFRKSPKYSQYADNLMAVKWLGNNASHDELSCDDVVKAYDIFGFVCEEIFQGKKNRINKISKEIIRRKGKKAKTKSPF